MSDYEKIRAARLEHSRELDEETVEYVRLMPSTKRSCKVRRRAGLLRPESEHDNENVIRLYDEDR